MAAARQPPELGPCISGSDAGRARTDALEVAVNILHLWPFLLVLIVPLLTIIGAVVATILLFRTLRRRAREQGHPSLRAYLRAAPRTDAEKRDAADLALKGLVLCLLGMIFAPAMLFGLVPLFYGARKVVYASMGLGFADQDELAR